MKDDAASVTDVSSASQGSYGYDEVWQLPKPLQALEAEGCDTLITELIALFKTEADSRLRVVNDAVISGNFKQIREQIHCLKGCASQLGADKMAAVCDRIELANSEGLTSDFPGQLKELAAVYQRVVRAMDVSRLNVSTLRDCISAG